MLNTQTIEKLNKAYLKKIDEVKEKTKVVRTDIFDRNPEFKKAIDFYDKQFKLLNGGKAANVPMLEITGGLIQNVIEQDSYSEGLSDGLLLAVEMFGVTAEECREAHAKLLSEA